MPPKRKALAVADANKEVAPRPAKKAARGAAVAAAAVGSKKGKEKEVEKEVETVAKSANSSKGSRGARATKGTKTAEASVPEAVPKETKALKAKKTAEASVPEAIPKEPKAPKAKKTAEASVPEAVQKEAKAPKAKRTAEVSVPEAVPKETKAPKAKKTAEASVPEAVPKEEKAPKAKKFKFSNAETLTDSPPLKFATVVWPGGEESDDEEDEEDEQPGDPKVDDIATEDTIKRVSNKEFPVTEDGMAKWIWINEEQEKRDQDSHRMYIYNDFSGYGTSEVMENLLADFNRILFKKDVSPFKKWAFVEGVAMFLKFNCIGFWMMIDDSQGLRDTLNMIGTMVLTSFSMLSEHDLLSETPLPSISIIALLLIEFLRRSGRDLDITWACEVVRALDKAGIELKPIKEVSVSQEHIDGLRVTYQENEEEDPEDGKNLYEVNAAIKKWEPDDDLIFGERQWLRWDWKKEFAEFKVDHPGGNQYNLEKWSKRDKAQYTFGSGEYGMGMGMMLF